MNLVGRILMVATFVMSIAFMTLAFGVYATHTNWKEAIEKTPDGLKPQLEKARADKRELRTRLDRLQAQLVEEQAAARNQLAKLESVRDELITKRDSLQKERDSLFEESQKQVAALATTQSNLDKLTEEVKVLRDDIRTAQVDRDKAFATVVEVTDKIHQSEGELTRTKEREQQVAVQYAKLKDLARKYRWDESGIDAPADLHGKVLAVSGANLVEVSIGSDDGLKVGNKLEVFRGSHYLGRIEVMRLDVDRAVGKILQDYKRGPIQKGDEVATHLLPS
jgi:myosin heavy subunit